jgi:hypothetical protein
MKVRAEVHENVPRVEVLRRLHQRLRPAVELSAIESESVDLFVYPPDSRCVVSSKDVLAPLERLERQPSGFVCVGYGFTQEARDYVHGLGGLVFSLEASFGWTDASWRSIHQTSAT